MNQNISIQGKRILFLAPAFFGYEIKIASKMEDMGAIVDFYDVRSVSSAFERALLKISTKLFINKTNRYYNEILEANTDKEYDYIFIVKCDMITNKILAKMKIKYRKAKFCLYLWDSIKNIPGIEAKFKYFDKILSFDRNDVAKYRQIVLRPLFYLDEFRKNDEIVCNSSKKFDLSFFGTIHSDRYRIIKEISNICEQRDLRFYSFKYLQSEFIYYYYKLIKKEFKDTKKDSFDYKKMNTDEIFKIVGSSKVVLDIQHPMQTGLTMRTIEMIGMHKKVITTNRDIVNYDFYDPQNIVVVSRENISIPTSFFESEYRHLDEAVYNKYYIENWIKEVLLI